FLIYFFADTSIPLRCTVSLHDALPIWILAPICPEGTGLSVCRPADSLPFGGAEKFCPDFDGRHRHSGSALPDRRRKRGICPHPRSEEHTSELQSRFGLVCRLLLE